MALLKKKIQDTDLEIIIGQLLRYGVLISSIIVIAGGSLYIYRHGHQLPNYKEFRGEPEKMRELSPLWEAVLRGEGRPLIQLGLLVLIATPIARIFFSIFGYVLEKDWLYAILTIIVLTVICWNF